MIKTAIARFDSTSFKTTPEGHLDAEVYPTRTGVLTYYYGGKIVRELRRPEEVFKPEELAKLINKSVTNGHPIENGTPVFLDVNNDRTHSIGHVYGKHDIAEDGIRTKSRVIIKDPKAIAEIRAGKVQVSCAYCCDYKEESGVYDGIPYDREQINIRDYNHMSIEWNGRAGSGNALKFDGAEIEEIEDSQTTTGGHPMVKVKFDGVDIEVDENAVQTIADAEAKRKADQDSIQELTEQVDSITTERDELKGKLDAQSIELENYRKQAAQAKLGSLKAEAAEHAPDVKLDGVETEIEIKRAVVSAKFDGIELDGKSDAEINGMYQVALLSKPEQPENLKKIDSAINQGKPFANVDLIEAARKKTEIRG